MAADSETMEKIAGGLDKSTRKFLLAVGPSALKWDLIRFYHSNPFALHTTHSLATFTGRRPDEVSKTIDTLVELGVLAKISQGEDHPPIYSFEPNDQIRQAVDKLVMLFANREDLVPKLATMLGEKS